MDLALLQAEAAAGICKKPTEELAKQIQYEPVEIRVAVIAGWRKAGLLPAAVIEDLVPQVSTTPTHIGEASAVVQ